MLQKWFYCYYQALGRGTGQSSSPFGVTWIFFCPYCLNEKFVQLILSEVFKIVASPDILLLRGQGEHEMGREGTGGLRPLSETENATVNNDRKTSDKTWNHGEKGSSCIHNETLTEISYWQLPFSRLAGRKRVFTFCQRERPGLCHC